MDTIYIVLRKIVHLDYRVGLVINIKLNEKLFI